MMFLWDVNERASVALAENMNMTIPELRKKVRKPHHLRQPWFIRNVISRVSIYLTAFFIKINVSGFCVLILCGMIELTGVLLLLTMNKALAFLGVSLLFLGLILDAVDGELRRYHGESRAWGIYLDRIMHRIIYPLLYICVGINSYILDSNISLLYFAISAAFFNQLAYFNKVFKMSILGKDSYDLTPTKLIRNKIEASIGKNLFFIFLLFAKRIYDHIFCNWVQYFILIVLISCNKLYFFAIFYGIGEPLKWLLGTFLDIEYEYIPDKTVRSTVYW